MAGGPKLVIIFANSFFTMFRELQTTDFLPEVNKEVENGNSEPRIQGSERLMKQAIDRCFRVINRLDC